ncbi:hypothetical protein [Acinetobacter bereziniae]|uniref:hypothetical protein n=1 Tax=Acinetobacter bereziniae TaxID=106648 RepID=UPI001C078F73|nr:hypothetical protein [Acinetobacter bereziniae]
MTPEQFAQFTIFNELNFYGGLILGLLTAGFFKTVKSFLDHQVQRPRRIKYRMLQGKTEKKTDFEYLYLFKGDYYTLEQRDFLIKQRLKDIKQFKPFYFSFFILLLIIGVFGFYLGTSFPLLSFEK